MHKLNTETVGITDLRQATMALESDAHCTTIKRKWNLMIEHKGESNY